MKLQRLHIRNIRSYRDLDMEFGDGVTVISGPNGSGKSSILEACFLALFGTNALSGTSLQTADMITRGETSAEIVLDFRHGGADYRIEQHFRLSKSGTASNSGSVLYRNGSVIADQAKKTYAAVCDILNMNEEAYANCAYIRQGEVDALINAKPKDRQKMIDDLLSLGKLEEYRERAAESVKAVNRLVRAENGKYNDLWKKADEYKKADITEEIRKKQEFLEKIDRLIKSLTNEKERHNADLVLIGDLLRQAEENREKKEDAEKALSLLEKAEKADNLEKQNILSSIALNVQEAKKAADRSEALRDELKRDLTAGYEKDPSVFNVSPEEIFSGPDETGKIAEAVRYAENMIRVRKQSAFEKRAGAEKDKKAAEDTLETRRSERNNIITETEKLDSQMKSDGEGIKKQEEEAFSGMKAARDAGRKYAEMFRRLFPDAPFVFPDVSGDEDRPDEPDRPNGQDFLNETDRLNGSDFLNETDRLNGQDFQNKLDRLADLSAVAAKTAAFINDDLEDLRKKTEEKKRIAVAGKSETGALKRLLDDACGERDAQKNRKKATDEEIRKKKAEAETVSKIIPDLRFLEKVTGDDIRHLLSEIPENMKEGCIPDGKPENMPDGHISAGSVDIDKISGKISEKRLALGAESSSLEAQLTACRETVSRSSELIRAGRCPTCGQPVDEKHLPCDLKKENERITAAEKRLAEIRDEIKKTDDLKKIVDEIRNRDRKLADLESNIRMSQTDLSGKQEMIRQQEETLKKSDEIISDLEKKIDDLQKKADSSGRELQKNEEDVRKGEEDLAEKRKNARRLEEIREETDRAISSVREAVLTKNNLKTIIKIKEEQIRSLRKAKGLCDEAVRSAEENIRKISADLQRLSEAEAALSQELDHYTEASRKATELLQKRHEASVLKASKDGLVSKLGVVSKAVEDKKKQIEEKKKEIGRLNDTQKGTDEKTLLEKRDEITSSLKEKDSGLTKWNGEKSNVLEKLGSLNAEQKQYDRLLQDIRITENRIGYLGLVREDAETLEKMYLQIRTELRSGNIRALDQLLNEMFSFIYANNAYSRIELDAEYNLKVYEKNGTVLEPRLLSGGERALFNLALRCAIYRFLSYGSVRTKDEDTATENGADRKKRSVDLPPMILDEPTVFLDAGHIHQLIRLIGLMKDHGVGQIIVVSHDESLIDSADRVFRVGKDSLTNTSSYS